MTDLEHSGDDVDERGGHRLTIAVGVVVMVAALIAGFVFLGTGEDEPGVVDASTGCRVHPLKFTVTDDPDVFAEQKRFEQDVNVLPKPAFYDFEVDNVSALHAAAHEYVVVFYGPGIQDDGRAALQALDGRAQESKAPVIIAPHDDEDDALVAIARGYELACPTGGAKQVAEVSRFAAQLYATVADPADPAGADGPAPDVPHAAPSPAEQ